MREQIEELNQQVKCTIRPSPIHGVGVFAIRDIKEGEKLYCQRGLHLKFIELPYEQFDGLNPGVRQIIEQRWPLVSEGSAFLSPNDDARLQSFMNDGGKEANYEPHQDIALRDIKKDEEITEDYQHL